VSRYVIVALPSGVQSMNCAPTPTFGKGPPTRSLPRCRFRRPEVRAERASKDAAEAPTEIGFTRFRNFKYFKSATADLIGQLRGHLRVTGMARRHLDNRRRRAFIPRIIFRARRGHDTPVCGKSASGREILRARGRQVGRWSAGRRSARSAGFATPLDRTPRLASGHRNPVRQARSRSLVSSGKGSRKPLAPPGAPFSFRTENGNGRPRARSSAGAAERWLHSLLIAACLFV